MDQIYEQIYIPDNNNNIIIAVIMQIKKDSYNSYQFDIFCLKNDVTLYGDKHRESFMGFYFIIS